VSESELKTIGKLESIDVSESVLNVRVDDEFRETEDFSTQVESVSESRLLSFFRGKGLDGLQIHVVIEMKVVQVLAVNEEVEHVVSLSANLETSFNPIDRSSLEEFGRFELTEQVLLGLSLWLSVTKLVEDVTFEQFLVGNSNLDSLIGRAMLEIPILDEGNILSPDSPATSLVVREGSVPQRDRVCRSIRLNLVILQESLTPFRYCELIFFIIKIGREDGRFVRNELVLRCDSSRRDGMNDGVVVESWEIGIFGTDVEVVRFVVRSDLD